MKISCLENVYFKKQDDHSLRAYKKPKNYCSGLYKKERNFFFNNLNPKFVSDNNCLKDNIYLADQDEIIQNDKKVAETLNIFFENAVSCLNLKENSFIINKEHKNIPDPIEKIIIIYQFHPIV